MTLEEAAHVAARLLPEGWQVDLCLERGAGWIDLYDEDGEKVEFDTSPDKDLAEQLRDAVNHALTANI